MTPIHDRLSCDDCGDDCATLRETPRGPFAAILCAACFGQTAQAAECNFTDYTLAQGASE